MELKKSALIRLRAVGRARTQDAAYPYVMPSGFAGDVTRGHPASIQADLVDPTNPPLGYGVAVLVNAANNAVRRVLAADLGITDIWGVTVRPYPFQQQFTNGGSYGATGYGGAVPPLFQPVDTLTAGYILVPVFGVTVKGGPVFLWTAASGGGHTVGGFESGATGGSTSALTPGKYAWNSPPDANGLAELKITL